MKQSILILLPILLLGCGISQERYQEAIDTALAWFSYAHEKANQLGKEITQIADEIKRLTEGTGTRAGLDENGNPIEQRVDQATIQGLKDEKEAKTAELEELVAKYKELYERFKESLPESVAAGLK